MTLSYGTHLPLIRWSGDSAVVRTPDGAFIVGLSTINNNASTVLFVYETASASILRSRTVTGQSAILSMAPDGSRFMAGFTLYDTSTLGVIAQQSANNLPFPLSSTGASFNTVQNVGGSVFAPDGTTLYSAFNSAPASTPATRAQASTLLISGSDNLVTRLGIKLPESILAKMALMEGEVLGLTEPARAACRRRDRSRPTLRFILVLSIDGVRVIIIFRFHIIG